jgi:hypothetical protein
MKNHRSTRLTETVVLAVLLCGFGLRAQATPADPGWPRYYSDSTTDLAVYQPQVDAWRDFTTTVVVVHVAP